MMCSAISKSLAFCIVLLAASVPANAETFQATLLGINEVPPNGSPGSGSITVTFNSVTDFEVSETFSGLTAPASAAHIHCCALPGVIAPVVLPFTQPEGFPIGMTAGTFNHTFNLTTDLTGIPCLPSLRVWREGRLTPTFTIPISSAARSGAG